MDMLQTVPTPHTEKCNEPRKIGQEEVLAIEMWYYILKVNEIVVVSQECLRIAFE